MFAYVCAFSFRSINHFAFRRFFWQRPWKQPVFHSAVWEDAQKALKVLDALQVTVLGLGIGSVKAGMARLDGIVSRAKAPQ